MSSFIASHFSTLSIMFTKEWDTVIDTFPSINFDLKSRKIQDTKGIVKKETTFKGTFNHFKTTSLCTIGYPQF